MFKTKIIIVSSLFITLLIITSVIKNKTRLIEKRITNLNMKILFLAKDVNETQLDFQYLTSPSEIEKKLDLIGLYDYKPIKYSNIFFDINDLTKIQNKISNLNRQNEKETQKK